MEALGYTPATRRMKIGRPCLFSTGMRFFLSSPAGPDRFNLWLDKQVKSLDGTINPARTASVAKRWDVPMTAKPWCASIKRLELGVRLRAIVDQAEYADTSGDRQHSPEFDQRSRKSSTDEAMLPKSRPRSPN
jgi:hypothetical protein